jgi:hypothetical protein
MPERFFLAKMEVHKTDTGFFHTHVFIYFLKHFFSNTQNDDAY